VDLIAWVPFLLVKVLVACGATHEYSTIAVVLYMSQITIVLKLDREVPAFTLLDDVLTAERGSGRLLICAGMLALILWLLFAALFYIVEKDESGMHDFFSTMPLSLFTTIIFLGGEWCRVDLAIPFGEITGLLLVLVGIGVCGIPVAIFFDGFCQIAEEADQSEAADKEESEEHDKGS
jgi:hypothetical protein